MSMRCLPLLLVLLAAPALAADLKDPTRRPPPVIVAPPGTPAAVAAPPRVSAIFISGSRQVAIFNDQPVRAGDSVGRFRIDEVTAHGVRYSVSGHSAFAPLAGH
jgi:hypothetical protein